MSFVWDVLSLLGLGSLLAGLWLISLPAALIVGGLALLALGILGARMWVSSRGSSRNNR